MQTAFRSVSADIQAYYWKQKTGNESNLYLTEKFVVDFLLDC